MISTCNEGLKLIKLKGTLTLHKITLHANGSNAPNNKSMKMDIALCISQILIACQNAFAGCFVPWNRFCCNSRAFVVSKIFISVKHTDIFQVWSLAKMPLVGAFWYERNASSCTASSDPSHIQRDNKTCKAGIKFSQCVKLPYFIHLTISHPILLS